MCFIDISELKFQVWLNSIKSKLRYKLSNMMSRVGLGWVGLGLGLGWVGLGLQTGLKDQLRLINYEVLYRDAMLITMFLLSASSSNYDYFTRIRYRWNFQLLY